MEGVIDGVFDNKDVYFFIHLFVYLHIMNTCQASLDVLSNKIKS